MDQCSSTTDFACGPAFFFSSNGTIDPEESRQLHDSYFINARVIQLNKSGDNSAECKCSDLKGFVAWDYTSRNNDRWTFINDNQTVIGNNYSAWQTEMLVGGLGKRYLFVHP